MLIKEHTYKADLIYLDIIVENKTFKAIVDTGSAYNYVSDKVAKTLDHTDITDISKFNIHTANGTEILIQKKIKLLIKIEDKDEEIEEEFLIFENLINDFVLGNQFNIKNNIKINMKNLTLEINGQTK